MKNVLSYISAFLLLILFIAPIFIIDILIIYFMNDYYDGIVYLLGFLILVYVFSMILNTVVENFLQVINLRVTDAASAVLDFFISLGVIFFWDIAFAFVDLTTVTKVLIVLIHSVLSYAIEKKVTGTSEDTNEEELMDSSVLYEIRTTLYTENVVNCINKVKENHPEIPKVKIIKAVRVIHEEEKS